MALGCRFQTLGDDAAVEIAAIQVHMGIGGYNVARYRRSVDDGCVRAQEDDAALPAGFDAVRLLAVQPYLGDIYRFPPKDDGRILTGCNVQQVQVLSPRKRSRRKFIAAARIEGFADIVFPQYPGCSGDTGHLRTDLTHRSSEIHILLCIPVVSGILAATVIHADTGWIHPCAQIYGQVRLGRDDRIDIRSSNVAWCTVGGSVLVSGGQPAQAVQCYGSACNDRANHMAAGVIILHKYIVPSEDIADGVGSPRPVQIGLRQRLPVVDQELRRKAKIVSGRQHLPVL